MAVGGARSLNARMRAFADAWGGTGTVLAALRTAGYAGTDTTLYPTATKLLKDPRVRARIEARLPGALAAYEAGPPDVPPPTERAVEPGLVKGRGRGTATERVELAMGLARSKKVDPKDRLSALRLAAELEGELRAPRPGRGRAPVTAPPASAAPSPAPSSSSPGLRLVVSDRDRVLEEPGHG